MAGRSAITGVAKRTLELREQFLNKMHNPYRHMTQEGGHVFDPAFYRHQAMRCTQIDHFKPSWTTAKPAIYYLIIPFAIMWYLVKNERDTKENLYRTGQVAYKDRINKFA